MKITALFVKAIPYALGLELIEFRGQLEKGEDPFEAAKASLAKRRGLWRRNIRFGS